MKKFIAIIWNSYLFVGLLAFITLSCNNKDDKKKIDTVAKAMWGKIMIVPENMERDFTAYLNNSKYTLISYIDSTDCTPCALKHIEVYKFYKDQLKNQFNTEILLLIQNNDEEGVKKMLSDIGVPFPFLLDIEKKFKSINNIPDNPTYQTLIVDEQRKIIWIGSPVENKKTWELYQKMMAKLSSKK